MRNEDAPDAPPAPCSFAERLFTPENVRILQSLGIGIIFISAIALVRNQMWSGASNLQRVGMLIGGTAICYAIGGLLYRWTPLRITGLGFLILGHLAMILDAYAALILPDSGQALYPFSPASLWACTFVLFTTTAYFHARALSEPLFDAFTLFGGLAAWISAALWIDISPWLIPAALVPAVLIARTLAFWLRPLDGQTVRRWSLEWWLRSCWLGGSKLLAVAMIGAAIYSGQLVKAPGLQSELARNFAYHAAAFGLLGLTMLAQVSAGAGSAQFGSLLLLLVVPMGLDAFEWNIEWMQLTLCVPGTTLLLSALGLRIVFDRASDEVRSQCDIASSWGLGATIAGVVLAAIFFFGNTSALALWSALCLTVAATAYAVIRRAPWAVWLATVATAFLAITGADRLGWSYDAWPVMLLGCAMVLRVLWHLARRAGFCAETSRHGAWSADALAIGAATMLLFLSRALIGLGLPLSDFSLARGWAGAALYLLLSAQLSGCTLRRSFALGLLSPALACALYAHSLDFGAPATALALLALGIFGVELWLNRADRSRAILQPGAGMVAAHALLLAVHQYGAGNNASAALAFALLAGLGVGVSIQARVFRVKGAALFEVASLGLVALAWLNVCALLGVIGAAWPSVFTLLAALILLLSLAAESIAGLVTNALRSEGDDRAALDKSARPFQIAGEAIALLLCVLTLEQLVVFGALRPHVWFVTNGWTAALLTAFIAVRPVLSRKGEPDSSAGALSSLLAGMLSGLLFAIAAFHAVCADFWLPVCKPDVRAACAVFFGATLAASVLAGGWLRRALSPVTGMLAALGLTGCAYGAWHLPVESFGLACVLLAGAGAGISRLLRRREELLRSGILWAMEFAAGSVALSGAVYMAQGLSTWNVGPLHAYSLVAWLLLAGVTTLGAQDGVSAWRTFVATIASGFAACHLMRWMGLGFDQFGPALAACALLALAAREMVFIAPGELEESRAQRSAAGAGFTLASLPLALAGMVLGLWGRAGGHDWLWCATLAESAAYLAAVAVGLRRNPVLAAKRALTCELGAWLLLALAASTAMYASGLELAGAGWALLGAILMALGMAAESAAGALLGSERHSRTPTPFLESRHLAAAALALFGVMQALMVGEPLGKIHIDATWRAMFGASALAIYLSLSAWSANGMWRDSGRTAASFAAYIVLIPLTYLCFLQAHSTGSSWGALWFILLAPVMYGAIYVLEREKQIVQAGMAKFGVAIVNLGALILAYAGNRAHLAGVPAATLALIAVQAAMMRRMGGPRELTLAACLASTGSVFYALRALLAVPAWGALEPCIFEMSALSAWALALVTLGGALKCDEDEAGISRVAHFGAWLSVVALFDALLNLFLRGANVRAMPELHLLRLDVLIMCLLLSAAAAVAARRWMHFEAGKYLAPAMTLIGYALFVLKEPVTNWEWITLPVALFLFLWARQKANEERHSEPEVSILLSLASSFALIPSFVQAIPYGDPAALWHAAVLLAAGLAMVVGAMFARRKIPLLSGSGAMLLLTLVKTMQWAAHRELFLPLVGIAVGFAILAMGSVFEARMNRLIRETLGRAKAEARMFWVSWN